MRKEPKPGEVWVIESKPEVSYRVESVEQTYDEDTREPLGKIARLTNLRTGGRAIRPLADFKDA